MNVNADPIVTHLNGFEFKDKQDNFTAIAETASLLICYDVFKWVNETKSAITNCPQQCNIYLAKIFQVE